MSIRTWWSSKNPRESVPCRSTRRAWAPPLRSGPARAKRRRSTSACTLISCRLETGRTHQIRIHLSEEGHPVVGERVYIRGYRGTVVPAPRLMLHAAELGFVHPATNVEMHWESKLPEDMQTMLA